MTKKQKVLHPLPVRQFSMNRVIVHSFHPLNRRSSELYDMALVLKTNEDRQLSREDDIHIVT